jgi:YidC/Oxa1 family membrane protein insertase
VAGWRCAALRVAIPGTLAATIPCHYGVPFDLDPVGAKMDRRTLLAITLSLLVVVGYALLMERFYPTPESERGEQVGTSSPAPVVPSAPVPLVAPTASSSIAVEEGVEISNQLVTLAFGRRTGGLLSVRLKRHLDEEGLPLELVPQQSALRSGQVLGADGKFVEATSVEAVGGRVLVQLVDGTSLTWTLTTDVYVPQLAVMVPQAGMRLVGPTNFSDRVPASRYYGNNGFAYGVGENKEAETLEFTKLKGPVQVPGPVGWVVSEDKYFIQGWLCEAPLPGVELFAGEPGKLSQTAVIALPHGESLFRVYLGPKEMDALAATSPVLTGRIYFGWFRVVAEPMFHLLRWLHKLVHSWGVAIILVTLLIKLLFFKLTHSQQRSMKKMQALQPEMAGLREKYKKDPQRMQREIMELYKRHKVNPMMGCLPMLVQIPVFIALYNVLLNTIELRHAPFLYLPDLSAPDALFGHVAGFAVGPLPLIMGVSMWVQQRMTPTTMEPMQAQVMKALPLVFTFMFLNFPSGLVLYWTVNNLLTLGQQAIVNRQME